MSRKSVLLLCLLAACDPYQTRVSVAVPGLDGLPSPMARLPIIFLPYDRDSILRTLQAQTKPQPDAGALDSLLTLARQPLQAYTVAVWQADSAGQALRSLRAALDTTPRNSAAYATGYAHFVALADSLPAYARHSADAQRALGRSDARLAGPIAELRAAIHQWEDSTYRDYGRITAELTRRLGRPPIADTTDAIGRVAAALPHGTWWLYARAPDVADPYGEWYWNVQVRGSIVRLDRTNAIHRPRT